MRRVLKLALPKHRWLLLHDNAPAHCTLNVKQFLASKSICVIHLPPYSPDLAPADFILFQKVKLALKAQRFSDISGTQCGVTELLTGFHSRISSALSMTCINDLSVGRSWGRLYWKPVIKTSIYYYSFFFVINAVSYLPVNVYYI